MENPIKEHCWVYILECSNGSYYTGYTTDLQARYQAHLNNTASCKYTRSFKPVKLAQSWCLLGDKRLAMRVEALIKTKSRGLKTELVKDPSRLKDWVFDAWGIELQLLGEECGIKSG